MAVPGRKGAEGPRFLITVSVLGSAGPIRFVVREGERVSEVVGTALKCYAREGRRPVLGSDLRDFLFYCSTSGSKVLEQWDTISSSEGRNFVLCRKQQLMQPMETTKENSSAMAASVLEPKGGRGIWKTWFTGLKVSSH